MSWLWNEFEQNWTQIRDFQLWRHTSKKILWSKATLAINRFLWFFTSVVSGVLFILQHHKLWVVRQPILLMPRGAQELKILGLRTCGLKAYYRVIILQAEWWTAHVTAVLFTLTRPFAHARKIQPPRYQATSVLYIDDVIHSCVLAPGVENKVRKLSTFWFGLMNIKCCVLF